MDKPEISDFCDCNNSENGLTGVGGGGRTGMVCAPVGACGKCGSLWLFVRLSHRVS